MSIKGFDESSFKATIKEYLSSARPITSVQHLKGREKALQQIDRALNSPGKHIFIYGDRGVGKTSLAQTAATLHHSSSSRPVQVSCASDNFFGVIRDAVKQAIPSGDPNAQQKTEHKLKASLLGFGYDMARTLTSGSVPPIESVNDATRLLEFVGSSSNKEPIIILDEFDQLKEESQKKICADLIKQVSDQGVNVRFIICGIGSHLEELIGVHLSTSRYLSPVELDRLTHDARWEIVTSAAEAVGVTIGHPHRLRIGQISDGFPSYVHLITEHVLWSMFDDDNPTKHSSQSHFDEGVNRAIKETETALKIIYEKATQKYSDDYEEVLWALADDSLLRRQTTDIYTKSYLRIMAERPKRTTLSKVQFSGRLNKLKDQRHGEILVGKGAGWFEFRENIVRGYVRLKAQSAGIRLGVEGHA